MDGGKHLVYPLSLSKSCSPRGKGNRADPRVLFVKRHCMATKKDAFVVARGSDKYRRGLLQVSGPVNQKILDVLEK